MSYEEYNEWKCDLIWCPSQITKTVIIDNKDRYSTVDYKKILCLKTIQ